MTNRTIKFRIFDKQTNKFLPDIGKLIIDCLSYLSDTFAVSQFTGLLDKNSKEIYEGDILKIKIQTDYQDNYYLVKSLEQLYLDCNKDDSYYRITEKEIKGNIFENPDLINGQL